MTTQDRILALGSFVLAGSLIFTILAATPVPLWTSVMMTVTLAVFTVTFATMHLRLTTMGLLAQTTAWGVIFIQGLS